MRADFDNAGWVEAQLNITLTPFQRRVADIVGIIGSNAYNCPVDWHRVIWNHGGSGVAVVWKNGHLSTFDFMPLTTLVFLCHDARIRLSIERPRVPSSPGLLLFFSQRGADGGFSRQHPDLNEAIADHRAFIPPEHPLMFRNHPEQQQPVPAPSMYDMAAFKRCPRCDSPSPSQHPAGAVEGEFIRCPHEWHLQPPRGGFAKWANTQSDPEPSPPAA